MSSLTRPHSKRFWPSFPCRLDRRRPSDERFLLKLILEILFHQIWIKAKTWRVYSWYDITTNLDKSSDLNNIFMKRYLTKFGQKIRPEEKRGKMWLHSMTIVFTPTQNFEKQSDNTKNATKIRLHSDLSNDSHQTGVVKPVYEIPTFPLTAIIV